MTVTIYHNPKCSTSRRVLALIRESGVEPAIVEYLKTPPTRAALAGLIKQAGTTARAFLRTKEALACELELEDASEAKILDAMAAHPILINRPIVATSRGVRLCRPPETVREILPAKRS